MSLYLAHVTFDCDNALAVARFWSAALGRPLDSEPSEHFASIGLGDVAATSWLFAKVPEPRTAKNRTHVDLASPAGVNREDEVMRLVGLGAERLSDKDEWGHRWTVMADPEGNEFCVA